MTSILKNWFSRARIVRITPSAHLRTSRGRLRLEPLEDRRLLTASGFLQGTAFVDANSNQILDQGDTYLPNATVELRTADSNNALLNSTTTDSNGYFRFDQFADGTPLTPGTYRLTEIPASGYVNEAVQVLNSPIFINPQNQTVQSVDVTVVDPSSISLTPLGSLPTVIPAALVGSNQSRPLFYGSTRSLFVGQLEFKITTTANPTGSVLDTFCGNPDELLAVNHQYNVNAQTTNAPASNWGRIAYLYNHYGSTAIPSDNPPNFRSLQAQALQLAIWELTIDSSTDLGSGDFQFLIDSSLYPGNTVDALNLANQFLTESADKSEAAIYLSLADSLQIGQSVIATGSVNFANTQVSFGSISGTKFTDVTGNGLSGDDTPLGGVTINLYQGASTSDPLITSTTTASDGTYNFPNLMPGTYFVQESVPAGYTQTGGNAGYVVNVVAGGTSTGNDFADFEKITIGGRKFTDVKGNDGGVAIGGDDTPLAGWTIELSDGINTIATTTAADGSYSFGPLGPGTYTVSEVANSGWTQTYGAAGYTIVATSGVNVSNRDFANFQNASITGTKFLDTTGNGFSADDTGLGGVTIKLYEGTSTSGVYVTSTVTAGNGTYSFTNVAPGTYFVQESVPSGYVQTGGDSGYVITVGSGVNSGGVSSENNFDNAEMCDLDHFKNISYLINGTTTVTDLRGNTQQGDRVQVTFTVIACAEPHPLTLVSYVAPGATFDPATANQQQIYDLATGVFGPGTYSLTVTIPNSYYQIDFVCGEAIDRFGPAGSNIFYTAQGRLFSADNGGTAAPQFNSSSLAGFVYNDANNNGKLDANEVGIGGTTVKLSGVDSTGKSVSATTTSAANGFYSFNNLKPGNYTITETTPSNYYDGKDTIGNQGGTTANDVFSSITLAAGVNGLYNNFGELGLPTLSGFVYLDTNNNGVKESGEAGIAGVTLKLTGTNDQGASVNMTTKTLADGAYKFAGLRASNSTGYTITETQPADYLDGKETIGTLSGTVGADVFSKIVLVPGANGTQYNFGESQLITKFYVVDDSSTDKTYEYSPSGIAGENYSLNSGNTAPRGAATTSAGTKVWVVDANKKVYVYNNSGGLLGSWTAKGLTTPTGITISPAGTDIWIVDSGAKKVFKYTNAGSLTSGSANAASSFALNSADANPTDLVTDGKSLWVIDDAATDKVFKYNLSGKLLGSWSIDTTGLSPVPTSPTGITLNPASVSALWIVDKGTDRVYQFDTATSRTSGSQKPSVIFALAAGNTNPQGIADPPPMADAVGTQSVAVVPQTTVMIGVDLPVGYLMYSTSIDTLLRSGNLIQLDNVVFENTAAPSAMTNLSSTVSLAVSAAKSSELRRFAQFDLRGAHNHFFDRLGTAMPHYETAEEHVEFLSRQRNTQRDVKRDGRGNESPQTSATRLAEQLSTMRRIGEEFPTGSDHKQDSVAAAPEVTGGKEISERQIARMNPFAMFGAALCVLIGRHKVNSGAPLGRPDTTELAGKCRTFGKRPMARGSGSR